MKQGKVNLFRAPRLLGSKPRYHVSKVYFDDKECEEGKRVEPDAGFVYVCTLPTSVEDVAKHG